MTEQSVRLLVFAVRRRVVLKYLGVLLLSMAPMAAVPVLVALHGEAYESANRFALVALLLVIGGGGLARIAAPQKIQINEALVVTALAFLIAAASMVWPLMADGLAPLDALFEATSGVTTTGLSVLPTVEGHSSTFLFARAWLQWYGGLAITVLALAFILAPSVATRRLAGIETDAAELVTGTRWRARQVLAVYVALTLAGVALLWLAGAAPFDALIHILAAVSTGGFSGYDRLSSLGPWPTLAVLALIMLFGATSFSLQYRAWSMGSRLLYADLEVRALWLGCLITFAALVACFAFAGPVRLADAAFLAISAQTTTGFANTPVSELPAAAQLVLIVSMGIGGDMGSTAGGIKILRWLVLIRLLRLLFARTAVPRHAVIEPYVAGRRLNDVELEAAIGIVTAYALAALLSWLPFLLYGVDPLAALFEVVSALSTCGLSAGVASPELHPLLKIVLCADMLMGRVEVMAFLILVYPRTWWGRTTEET
ncbi:TrkH family potassium uptake protein [Candidatus Competibacter phosphatis]|nr:TrkH family potassium uptake protein [Candidatus Competibacter phosphatis]